MPNSVIRLRLLVPLIAGALCLVGMGCDNGDKISRLEKQIQALQTEAKKDRTVTDYDLQAKCSKDAKAWFRENWQADKDTILLDYQNHYNKSLNKCFAFVEHHSSVAPPPSWMNNMSLWDVYENSEYGSLVELHINYGKPGSKVEDLPPTCTIRNKTCKTVDEFNGLVQPHMNN